MPITLIDKIKQKNDGDFPLVEDGDLYGGWRVAADITARNAIPSERRLEGMRVKVQSDGKVYELTGGITNSDWAEVTVASAAVTGVLTSTEEDLSIDIDYNGVSVGDPGEDTLFQTQADVDGYLASAGWTAFKHIESAYNALPDEIIHEVTFNLASGEHRCIDNGDNAGILMDTKTVTNIGVIRIIGSSVDEWTLFDPSLEDLTVTASQLSSGDPWVQFAGTPFNGFSLKGHFAVFSSGVIGIIHDHTDDTLYIVDRFTSTPVGQTMSIMDPSTVIKNLADDGVTQTGTGMLSINSLNISPPYGFGFISFERCLLDITNTDYTGVSALNSFRLQDSKITSTTSISSNQLVAFDCSYVYILNSIIAAQNAGAPMYIIGRGKGASDLYIDSAYFLGPTIQESTLQEVGATMLHLVMDQIGKAGSSGAIALYDSYVDFYRGFGGKYNEIRNISTADCGLYFLRNSTIRDFSQRIIFKDCDVPCVLVGPTLVDLSFCGVGDGFIDGGGNTDVGIELAGSRSTVRLNQYSDVTGAAGDIRLQGGGIVEYVDVTSSVGGIIDEGFNKIEVV